MRTLPACTALLLLPLSALAAEPNCAFSADRALTLDTTGVKAVVFEIHQHDLDVTASRGGGQLTGRACASNKDWLDQLKLDQRRSGDKLVVSLRRDAKTSINFSTGNSYAWLDIRGSVPDNLPLQFKVGSGDLVVHGAQSLSVDLGSGDAKAHATAGSVHAAVGSGDLLIDGAASVDLLSLGSGDATLDQVRGNASIGTVGSGDLRVAGVGRNVSLDTVGSGDVDIKDVKGNAEIGVIGSGDIDLRSIGGNVHVRRHGSGDVDADGVGGNLTVDQSGSGDVRHRNVTGDVTLPGRR